MKYPLSLRSVEDLLHERGIDVCYETVQFGWNRFGPMFAAEIRATRIQRMRPSTPWRWRRGGLSVKIKRDRPYPSPALRGKPTG